MFVNEHFPALIVILSRFDWFLIFRHYSLFYCISHLSIAGTSERISHPPEVNYWSVVISFCSQLFFGSCFLGRCLPEGSSRSCQEHRELADFDWGLSLWFTYEWNCEYEWISALSSTPFQAMLKSFVACGVAAAVYSEDSILALIYSALSSVKSSPQLVYLHAILSCWIMAWFYFYFSSDFKEPRTLHAFDASFLRSCRNWSCII